MPKAALIRLAILLAAALAIRVVLVVLLRERQTHDVRIFVAWAELLARYGSHHFYQHVDPIDRLPVNYPPLFSLILGVIAHGGADPVWLGMLIKLPAVVADLALSVLAFVIVARWSGTNAALVAAALAAFAPSTWPISALWGQVDSLCAAFMLLALALVIARRYTWAWVALALAVLVKPIPVVVAPLIAVAQIREQGWSLRLLAGPTLAMLVAYLISLPFAPDAAPATVASWLVRTYATGQSLSHWTSVNAYNVWTAFAAPVPDANVMFGLTLHAWGWIAFAAVAAPVMWFLYCDIEEPLDDGTRERTMTRAWFMVLAAFFLFETRMHERYILFALALFPLMWYCGRQARGVATTFLITFTIGVIMVLGFYEHGIFKENATITHLLSIVNIGAFAVLAGSYFAEGTRSPDEPHAASNIGPARSTNSPPMRPQS